MIVLEEGRIITLENNGKYFLATDIGELEENSGKKYFFAVGVTQDYKIDLDDIIFIETYKENENYIAEKVDENSELYATLAQLQVTKEAILNVPGFAEKLQQVMENAE